MTKIILALAAIAATGNALEPPRRRLRDSVDLTQIKEQAEASAFTGSLSFNSDSSAGGRGPSWCVLRRSPQRSFFEPPKNRFSLGPRVSMKPFHVSRWR